MPRLHPVVPGNVRHQVANTRKRVHRLDGHGLVELQLAQPRHAHQPRLPVDFRRARPALPGFAVPADRQIVGLRRLDAMHHVQHHHPRLDLGRVIHELARRTRRRARCGTSRSPFTCSPRSPVSAPQAAASVGTSSDLHAAIRGLGHADVAPAPVFALVRIIVAEMAAAALFPLSAARAMISETVNRFRQIERRVPAVVVLAISRRCRPSRRATFSFSMRSIARSISSFAPHDADQVLHHLLQFVLHRVRILTRRLRARTAPAPSARLPPLARC